MKVNNFKTKRILAAVLSLALAGGNVFTAVPDLTVSYAAENDSVICIRGNLGENASWEYDNGVLTVKGEGPMKECVFPGFETEDCTEYYPWLNFRETMTKVVIGEGITSVSGSAFEYCPNLRQIELASTVTSIGELAFSYCRNLESVTFPEGLQSIERYAFANCSGMKKPVIPESVTKLDKKAFSGCDFADELKAPAENMDEPGDVSISVTNATVNPGGTTFLDIIVTSKDSINAFITALQYDKSVFSVEALSVNEAFAASQQDLVYDLNNDRFLYFNSDMENVHFDNSYAVRVALKVKEDAPEGEYKITPFYPNETGAAASHINSDNTVMPLEAEFISGTVKVSKTEKPVTETSPLPLSRSYFSLPEGESKITGDTTDDGIINAADLLKTKKYFLGSDNDISYADTNEDGSLNITDYIILQDYILSPTD